MKNKLHDVFEEFECFTTEEIIKALTSSCLKYIKEHVSLVDKYIVNIFYILGSHV